MNNFVPPLRMVLTAKCNGNCLFCHHEGYTESLDMSIELARASARAAEKLHIPYISITGGEPTLHPQLVEILSAIQQASKAKISLTTNGYNLLEIGNKIENSIQKLNVSIASFDPTINRKYQNVDIDEVKTALLKFPSVQKNFNVVINSDNYEHLDEIVSFCNSNSINLDLMFEVSDFLKSNVRIEKYVIDKIKFFGEPIIIPGCPSSLSFSNKNGTTIRIKHPQLSSLIKRSICTNCNEYSECLEKVCAVRVYPDGSVTPCLSKHYYFKESDIEKNIIAAYRLFDQDESILQTLFEE